MTTVDSKDRSSPIQEARKHLSGKVAIPDLFRKTIDLPNNADQGMPAEPAGDETALVVKTSGDEKEGEKDNENVQEVSIETKSVGKLKGLVSLFEAKAKQNSEIAGSTKGGPVRAARPIRRIISNYEGLISHSSKEPVSVNKGGLSVSQKAFLLETKSEKIRPTLNKKKGVAAKDVNQSSDTPKSGGEMGENDVKDNSCEEVVAEMEKGEVVRVAEEQLKPQVQSGSPRDPPLNSEWRGKGSVRHDSDLSSIASQLEDPPLPPAFTTDSDDECIELIEPTIEYGVGRLHRSSPVLDRTPALNRIQIEGLSIGSVTRMQSFFSAKEKDGDCERGLHREWSDPQLSWRSGSTDSSFGRLDPPFSPVQSSEGGSSVGTFNTCNTVESGDESETGRDVRMLVDKFKDGVFGNESGLGVGEFVGGDESGIGSLISKFNNSITEQESGAVCRRLGSSKPREDHDTDSRARDFYTEVEDEGLFLELDVQGKADLDFNVLDTVVVDSWSGVPPEEPAACSKGRGESMAGPGRSSNEEIWEMFCDEKFWGSVSDLPTIYEEEPEEDNEDVHPGEASLLTSDPASSLGASMPGSEFDLALEFPRFEVEEIFWPTPTSPKARPPNTPFLEGDSEGETDESEEHFGMMGSAESDIEDSVSVPESDGSDGVTMLAPAQFSCLCPIDPVDPVHWKQCRADFQMYSNTDSPDSTEAFERSLHGVAGRGSFQDTSETDKEPLGGWGGDLGNPVHTKGAAMSPGIKYLARCTADKDNWRVSTITEANECQAWAPGRRMPKVELELEPEQADRACRSGNCFAAGGLPRLKCRKHGLRATGHKTEDSPSMGNIPSLSCCRPGWDTGNGNGISQSKGLEDCIQSGERFVDIFSKCNSAAEASSRLCKELYKSDMCHKCKEGSNEEECRRRRNLRVASCGPPGGKRAGCPGLELGVGLLAMVAVLS